MYSACRKIDTEVNSGEEKVADVEQRFFGELRSSDLVERNFVEYVKVQNQRFKFVNQLSHQLGFPVWNKSIFMKRQVGSSSYFSAADDDSLNIAYIPFVRDGELRVNSALKITMSDTDTTFRLLQDWQYADTAVTGMKEKDYALLFMVLHNRVTADTLFHVLDSSIFPGNGTRATRYISLKSANFGEPPAAQGLLIAYHFSMRVCYTGYRPTHEGQLVGCPPDENCPHMEPYETCETISWIEWIDDQSNGGGDGVPEENPGGGPGNGGWNPPPCNGPSGFAAKGNGNSSNYNEPCTPGWEPEPIEEEPLTIDVISDPNAPSYPDISEDEDPVDLQALFNCFAQIPDAGASYSVKLCVDLPVNGMWSAPFNLTQRSPGHTFLTLTKTNGSQSISQTVGFYPVEAGKGNPYFPNAIGAFKNNGNPVHEYNAAINVTGIAASQFNGVISNLLQHEHDTYNIFYNNCTTRALYAFNMLVTPPLSCQPFVVSPGIGSSPFVFAHSPQKLYKTIETFSSGSPQITKEFNVVNNSIFSDKICL